MADNESLYRKAVDAITALYSDVSVPRRKARENMISLQSEIDILLSTLYDENEED